MTLPHARQAIHEQVHSFKHHFPNKEFVSMFGETPVMIGQLKLPFSFWDKMFMCFIWFKRLDLGHDDWAKKKIPRWQLVN